jgi:hypothetical protein
VAPPGYAAEATLYTSSRLYRPARFGPAAEVGPTVVAQHDPCALPGGARPVPMPCPVGEHCCGSIRNGRCLGECAVRCR